MILVIISVSTLTMAVIPIFILHTFIMLHTKLTVLPWDRGPVDMLIGVSYLEEMNYINIHISFDFFIHIFKIKHGSDTKIKIFYILI